MSRREELLPTPQGIGPGQTATVNLTLGPTYHRFDIRMKAAATGDSPVDVAGADWVDYIDDIRVIVDGDVKIEATADLLAGRAQYYGIELQDGVLPVFLSMPWARTMGGEDQSAYGTFGGMSTFTLEIDLKADINIGELRVYAQQSEPRPFGPHLRIQRFAKSFGAVGVDEVSDLPLGAYALLSVDITSANIGDVEIFANNNRVHVSDRQTRYNGYNIAKRTRQVGHTHLDFMPTNRVGEALPMALQDFRMKLGFTTAPGAYSMYVTSLQGVGAR